MEKKNKISIVIILVCTAIVVGICIFAITGHVGKKISDGEKFKLEFERYNNATITGTDKHLLEVKIDKENPMQYKTPKEIVEVLKKKDAIVFFGNPKSALTRCAVEPLLKAAKDNNIENIYYVNIDGIQDEYELVGFLQFNPIREGSKSYHELIKFFDEKLENYCLSDQNGFLQCKNEKRLNAPTLAVVKDKKVLALHEKTVKSQLDEYEELSKEEIKELIKIYSEVFKTAK